MNSDTTGAPPCAPPDFHPRKPKLSLPRLTCDTHAHILGPIAQYDYSPARVYTPPGNSPVSYTHLTLPTIYSV